MRLTSLFNTSGNLGAIIAAMGCAGCFPALGTLAATLGLGFLAQFEGLFINTLLPVFAAIALVTNLYSDLVSRYWLRMVLGIAGPLMVLATLYLFWSDYWSTYMFYAGLCLMLLFSIWEIALSAQRVCASSSRRIE